MEGGHQPLAAGGGLEPQVQRRAPTRSMPWPCSRSVRSLHEPIRDDRREGDLWR